MDQQPDGPHHLSAWGSRFTWKIQHNILHHTYTNIYGLDEDIHDKPILRLSPHGRLGFLHRYQHVYGFLLYGLATLGWDHQQRLQTAYSLQ